MPDNRTKLNPPKSLDNFTRGLLSTTCLTVACGASAVAGTVALPTSDFPNTTPGVLLGVGTTGVTSFIGNLSEEMGGGFIGTEWFEFQGLTPGTNYTFTANYLPVPPRSESGNGESGVTVNLLTNSQTPLFSNQSIEGVFTDDLGVTLNGVVPSDGFLDVEVVSNQIPSEGSGSGSAYLATLTAETGSQTSGVPEPGTMATVGLALTGALAWSRRRRQ